MEYRQLGKSGIAVSEIALGGWLTFGEQVDTRGVAAIVKSAVEVGVNLFDLADVYAHGRAEETFGAALKSYNRHDLVITSKAFWPMGEGPNNRGLSRKHLFESIDGTLRRLGTEYVDIYFCHRFDKRTSVAEVAMAMSDLIRQGKVLYWGTSVWTAAQITEAAGTAERLLSHPPRAEQPRYNMLDRHIEIDIMSTAATHGVGLVVWSPLAQGVLTGKYSAGIPKGSRGDRLAGVRRNITPAVLETVERLRPVADAAGLTLSQLALAWCLRRPEVSSVITGASDPDQVRENARAAGVRISSEHLTQIEAILGNRPEVQEP